MRYAYSAAFTFQTMDCKSKYFGALKVWMILLLKPNIQMHAPV